MSSALLALIPSACFADGQEKFDVNSPVQRLSSAKLPTTPVVTKPAPPAPSLDDQALYKTGVIDEAALVSIIDSLTPAAAIQADQAQKIGRVTIIHLLRWADAEHKTAQFEKWYVYDPQVKYKWSYVHTSVRVSGDFIAGRTHFRLIYVHLNKTLGDGNESIKTSAAGGSDILRYPIGYKIAIQKQQPQLLKDALTVLQILGGFTALSAEQEVGYYSVFDFQSAYSTSTVSITASLADNGANPASKTTGSKTQTGQTAANDLAAQTYTNQPSQWFGLGFAVPLKSYKDVQYQQSGSSLQPNTINRQNVYLTANVYLPAVETGNLAFRWLPHPFFGVPIKGEPLRNTMVGIGNGFRWLQPFWGVVFDLQKVPATSNVALHNRLVIKGVYGLNLSVDAVAKALLPKKSS
jgi:hypothetical protein